MIYTISLQRYFIFLLENLSLWQIFNSFTVKKYSNRFIKKTQLGDVGRGGIKYQKGEKYRIKLIILKINPLNPPPPPF